MSRISLGVIAVLAAVIAFLFFLRGCNHNKPPVVINNPTISVTPVVDPSELEKLPELPNNEKPVSSIPVPTPVPVVGKIVIPSVVVSDKGNTFVVYSEKVDCGFRVEPKLSAGVSDKLLLGLDATFFTYWRFNADALIFVPAEGNIGLTRLRIGVGVSYKITENTSAGLGFLKDFGTNDSFVGFVSLKF